MLKSALRNTLLLASLACGGGLMSLATSALVSTRGVPGPLLSMAERPVAAAVTLAALLVPATLLAIVAGRAINAVVGVFVLGASLAVLAMQCGTVEDLAFGGGSLMAAAIETAVWSAVVAVLALIVFIASGPLPDLPRRSGRWTSELADSGTFLFLLASLAAPAVAWVLLASPSKGQAIGATVVGSVAAGLLGRLLAPRTQPVLIFALPILAAAGVQFLLATRGGGSIADAFAAGTLPRNAFPMPIDWAAGSMCGVAYGLGWARSMVRVPDPTADMPKRVVRG
ncbi:MAG: hypothetical protein FJ257_00775 [Phycisphaerae bacterium]|nr:hypothetical protein [Phycisphaerae bacterium]